MKQPPFKAVGFSLPDESGNEKTLNDFAGKWLVLYFYPKDDTPGCTIQACSLRDASDDLSDLGAEVVGVSKDSTESHDKFKAKHSLNFTLLSDESGNTITAYGAWGKKTFGQTGILRKTYLIDPDGIVQKVYGKAVPIGHGDKVVKDLLELQRK